MDLFSKLPEPILCHILSFLPTINAASCRLLSTRWKSLWKSVPVLDFDLHRDACGFTNQDVGFLDSDLYREICGFPNEDVSFLHLLLFPNVHGGLKREERFAKIVEKLLFLPRDSSIKIFRLRYSYFKLCNDGGHLLHKWASIIRCVEELHLTMHFTFPKGTTFNNMLVLELTDSSVGSVESCLFPRLRVLHLLRVFFDASKGASLESFLSACPVLEELKKQRKYDLDHLRICVPTLTSLVLQPEMYGDQLVSASSKLVLETPALEYLSFNHHGRYESIVAPDLFNLRRADINCFTNENEIADKSYGSCVMRLLAMLSSVEFLRLRCDTVRVSEGVNFEKRVVEVQGLVHGLDYSCVDTLPVFHNLVRLELCIPSCDYVLLLHLLRKFHSLEYIAIDKKLGVEVAKACWKEPMQVPLCLSSTLLSFRFEGFEGYKAEVELIKYVMKHAKVLKSLTLNKPSYFKESMTRVCAVKELLMVTKVSEECQFHLN